MRHRAANLRKLTLFMVARVQRSHASHAATCPHPLWTRRCKQTPAPAPSPKDQFSKGTDSDDFPYGRTDAPRFSVHCHGRFGRSRRCRVPGAADRSDEPLGRCAGACFHRARSCPHHARPVGHLHLAQPSLFVRRRTPEEIAAARAVTVEDLSIPSRATPTCRTTRPPPTKIA